MADSLPVPENTVCQFCTESFNKKDIVVPFQRWDNDPEGLLWSHLDCILYGSDTENREHPPRRE